MAKCKVIVIGAGIAGLTAARELKGRSQDMDVIVLEGAERIGGRVYSSNIGGHSAEHGATWLHGKRKFIRIRSAQ